MTTPLCGTPLRPHRPPPVHSSSTARRPRRAPCREHLEDTAARARLTSAPGEDVWMRRPVVWTRASSSVAGGRCPPLLVGCEGALDDGALGAGGGGERVLAPAFAPASAPGRFLVLRDGDLAGEPAPWTVPTPRARSARRRGTATTGTAGPTPRARGVRVRPGAPGRRRAAGRRSVPNPAVITARPAPAFETTAGPPEAPTARH